jgi:SAM-dependent methyltransferase
VRRAWTAGRCTASCARSRASACSPSGPDKTFESTPLSDTLRSDAPDSLRYTAMSELGVSHFGPWGEFMHSLKTGRPSFDHVFGMPVFEWFGKNPDRAKIFNTSMTELTNLVEPAVLEAYDFSGCGTIVDVGGGHGGLIAAILKKHANLDGVVYDSPQVVADAPALFEEHGVAERASVVGGDFFKSVPAGGDTYVMKHIIHDWDDNKCTTLLKHCHGVMKPGGKLLVVDQVLPEGNAPSISKFFDLLMMIMPGGTERTEAEFKALLTGAGFKFSRVVPTKSFVSVVEAIK